MDHKTPPAVHADPEIMGGTPMFVGTRVPFQTLLDYLEAGDPLGEFLEDCGRGPPGVQTSSASIDPIRAIAV